LSRHIAIISAQEDGGGENPDFAPMRETDVREPKILLSWKMKDVKVGKTVSFVLAGGVILFQRKTLKKAKAVIPEASNLSSE
jgi:hypothetical protein